MINSKIIELHEKIKMCYQCDLCKSRKKAVPGIGSLNPSILFIGEAPGSNEDEKGEPFVGRAGKFLDTLLKSVNIKRKDIFITNIVKCRPPRNRDPQPNEIDTCSLYLDAQIKYLNPKIICPLGRFSAKYVLEKFGFIFSTITGVAGETFTRPIIGNGEIQTIRIIPLFHPCVAIYNRQKKDLLLKHFVAVKEALALTNE